MTKKLKKIILKLYKTNNISKRNLMYIFNNISLKDDLLFISNLALKTKEKYYGNKIIIRSLLEFSNICSRNCIYCGINNNILIQRYNLTKEIILQQIEVGYNLGIHSFVLQSGENNNIDIKYLSSLIESIKNKYNDISLTLSIGEKTYDEYKMLKNSGADRFLLRHETVNKKYYSYLHPGYKLKNRLKALMNLKKIGYQTGTGFMVGLNMFKVKDYVNELLFIKKFKPHMIGIGPFIPNKETVFKDDKTVDVNFVLLILALTRLLNPYSLIPSTTALSTITQNGFIKGFSVGCNVIMPNITPYSERKKYTIYDNKKIDDNEDLNNIKNTIKEILKNGYDIDLSRGDYLNKIH